MAQRVQLSTDRMNGIITHEQEQQRNLTQNQLFETTRVRIALEDDLRQINNSVITFSKVCLHNLYKTSQQLQTFQTSLDHVEGALTAIRSDAGRQLITIPQCPDLKSSNVPVQPFSRQMDVQLPSPGFRINTAVFEGVGRPNDANPSTPLILPVQKGNPMPSFWSRQTDYFIPTTTVPPCFETSFSIAYGFDGARCIASVADEEVPEIRPRELQGGRTQVLRPGTWKHQKADKKLKGDKKKGLAVSMAQIPIETQPLPPMRPKAVSAAESQGDESITPPPQEESSEPKKVEPQDDSESSNESPDE
jgi:hypothetical protein